MLPNSSNKRLLTLPCHSGALPVWRIPVDVYAAVPTWRCSNVLQFRRHVNMAHAFCLDNNLFINDLQTESTVTVSTFDVS